MQLPAIIALFVVSATARTIIQDRQVSVNTDMIPLDFGITRNSQCLGAKGKSIPCNCPPDSRDPDFIAKLGQSLSQGFFPDASIVTPLTLEKFNNVDDKSEATNRQRATAMVQVLQSLSGNKGQGCPGVSYPNIISQQSTGVFGGVAGGNVGNAGKF
ncbi:hypothetical protein B0H63DRAFT_179955 [Podospora didyma]|uniref:Uncharacterized protein n=1 Tax=Podospora didyma TaxID=330526 RepID=A0AAE0NPD4_9PEZI|nr:hypothetical protein B0H63DRAFT_179955 [Podospora didyma]